MIMQNSANTQTRSAPAVDFYGDESSWPTSELLHSEKLVERSELHDWQIRPHRHSGTAQLFLVVEGSGRARIDSVWHKLSAPCLVVIPERAVHEFAWHKSSDGYVLSIRSSLITALTSRITTLGTAFSKPAVIDAEEDRGVLVGIFAAIHDETQGKRSLMDAALDSLVNVLAIWLARRTKSPVTTAQPIGRATRHFTRLTQLVEAHHKEHWTVADYAKAIGITPSHLNAVCQELSGKSTLELVHARLILAAQRELAYTERNIAGVAGHVGFDDPSYFTRFFKRETGMTPGDYRRRSGTYEG